MDSILTATNVSKAFKDHTVVDDISFSVEKGSFCALLGPNGSGKSTTLKMCSNIIQPTSGNIMLNGIDVQQDPLRALENVGCAIEAPEVYQDCTPSKVLAYFGMISGMTSEEASSEVGRVLDIVNMSDKADERIKKFSKGMKQRITLAQALLGSPSLLLLDEPTSGLDPQGTLEINQIMSELNRSGVTIIMSSHMLHEVEMLCDDVIIINSGHIAMQSKMKDVVNSAHIHVAISGEISNEIMEKISTIEGVRSVDAVLNGVSILFDGDMILRGNLLKEMISMDLCVYEMSSTDPLNEIFFNVTGESR